MNYRVFEKGKAISRNPDNKVFPEFIFNVQLSIIDVLRREEILTLRQSEICEKTVKGQMKNRTDLYVD